MIKKIKQAGAVISRLRPFIAPYKWGFIGAVVMTVLSVAAMTSAPRIEGMNHHPAGQRRSADCRKSTRCGSTV